MATEAAVRHETGIQWTHVPGYVGATWNPTTGCTRVSPGCDNCYAFTLHDQRFAANLKAADAFFAERGIVAKNGQGGGTKAANRPRLARDMSATMPLPPQYDVPFSTVQMLDGDRLTEPLRKQKPHAYFVDSMADLFHEDVPVEFIDRAFAVMALAPQHIFMILTKRPERMRAYLSKGRAAPVGMEALELTLQAHASDARSRVGRGTVLTGDIAHLAVWPLPNVWLGVSAEDRERLDGRVPLLLDTPAAVRFISYEPALGPLGDIDRYIGGDWFRGGPGPYLDWIIVGGESGARARAFDVAWARSVVEQGRAAGVPVFVKQMGARPYVTVPDIESGDPIFDLKLKHSHGSNPDEWPEDLRVREWPALVEVL